MLYSLAAAMLATRAVGFLAGRRYERAAHGWADYRVPKAEVPILRAAAGLLSIKAVGAVSLAVLVAAWCLYVLATDSPK